MIKFIFTLIFSIFLQSITYASEVYFLDFSKVLNQSQAGSKFQEKLKNKIRQDTENFSKLENEIKKEESDTISQKKILSQDEYEKKIKTLREKVGKLQSDKQKSFNDIANSRDSAKKKLIDNINPILKKYMEDNNIRVVLDKQSVVLGDTKLEITDAIIELLNKKLLSLD